MRGNAINKHLSPNLNLTKCAKKNLRELELQLRAWSSNKSMDQPMSGSGQEFFPFSSWG